MRWLWNERFLHFGQIGTFGRLFRESTRRSFIGYFPTESEEESRLLEEYFWHLHTAQRQSTDVATNIVLEPLATDDERVSMYGRRPVASEPEERLALLRKMPVTLVYGDADWLYAPEVEAFARDIGASLHFIAGAAHHMYAENRKEYDKVIRKALAGR